MKQQLRLVKKFAIVCVGSHEELSTKFFIASNMEGVYIEPISLPIILNVPKTGATFIFNEVTYNNTKQVK